MPEEQEFTLELQDGEWPFTYTDHDRLIVRAIVYDEAGYFYFVRAIRNDEFGPATLIETSGGGVEPGEAPEAAVRRELREELGAEVEIVRRLGLVSDYYNLIHRHNLNHYYLCRVRSFGEKHLTPDEVEDFHLSTLRLRYAEAVREYERRADTPLGRLLANRELPVLRRAGALLGADQGPAEDAEREAVRTAFEEAERTILPGRYRHFKGREYEVLGVARHSETEEPLVVYRKCYGDGSLWVRPAGMWNETVERDGQTFVRFTRLSEPEEKGAEPC